MSDEKNDVVMSFKGFNNKWQCRGGYQYEVGKTYVHDGGVVRCESGGFHSCEYPLDIFTHYPPVSDGGILNKFAKVECSGEIARDDSDSKFASARLTVKVELTIPELVDYAVRWILGRIEGTRVESNTGNRSAATNTGYRSAATNTGYRSAATNTGYQSAATNTGNRSAATNTGNRSATTNTGDQSATTNTGDQSATTNTGDQSAATNTGYQSAATNTGNQSAATNTGNQSAATNTGNRSAATNTGNQSAATNTGNRSAATNTGYRSTATNTGNQSAATNTGNRSAASVDGKDSVAIACGYAGRAKASEGSAIVLVFRDENHRLVHIKAGIAGRGGIKVDTWYSLDKNGEFVEVEV